MDFWKNSADFYMKSDVAFIDVFNRSTDYETLSTLN